MSHFNTLRSKLTNAEILKEALCDLGLIVKTDAEVRGMGYQRAQADIVAVLAGDYDIGWSRNPDGSFDLIADLWGVAQKHNLADLMSSVNQKYAVKQTMAEVKRPGLQNANIRVAVQAH
ncbi:MAG TPA: DUF1257 domain-containing protein [Allocoleopsis sp.]